MPESQLGIGRVIRAMGGDYPGGAWWVVQRASTRYHNCASMEIPYELALGWRYTRAGR